MRAWRPFRFSASLNAGVTMEITGLRACGRPEDSLDYPILIGVLQIVKEWQHDGRVLGHFAAFEALARRDAPCAFRIRRFAVGVHDTAPRGDAFVQKRLHHRALAAGGYA